MPALDDYYRYLERNEPPTQGEADGSSTPALPATAFRWTIRGGLTIRVPVASLLPASAEDVLSHSDVSPHAADAGTPPVPAAEIVTFAPPILDFSATDGLGPTVQNNNGHAAPDSWSVVLPVAPRTAMAPNGNANGGNGQLGLPLLSDALPIAVAAPATVPAQTIGAARGDSSTTAAHWDRLPAHLTLLARYLDPQADEEVRQTVERLLDPTVTLEESAKLLGVCAATVRRYANKGILGHQRTPGNQRRFRLSEVAAFLERQSSGLADLSNGGNGDGHG